MFTSLFWKLSAERAVKTFAQALLASVLVVGSAGLLAVDWRAALSTAGAAALVSVLTSLGSLKVGPENSPSLVPGEPPATPDGAVPAAAAPAPVAPVPAAA